MFEPNDEQIQQVIVSSDTLEGLADLQIQINNSDLAIQIDPKGLYCQKTGEKIGLRSENSLFQFFKIHGKNNFVSFLYNSTGLSVAPSWIKTDGVTLDILMDGDPIGYACYCFNLITAQFYQTQKNQNPKRRPFAEKYWAMARAHELMRTRGIANVTELNQELGKIITFMPDSASYLFKRIREFGRTPDMLANMHCNGQLIEILRQTTDRALESIGHAQQWIKRTRYIDYAATPEDAMRGPSNVRKQDKLRRPLKDAIMFSELQKLFADSGITLHQPILKPKDNFMAWKLKKVAEENAMIADLIAIGGSNLDIIGTGDHQNEEDNEIEIRRIAIEKIDLDRQGETSKVSTEQQQSEQYARIDIDNDEVISVEIIPIELISGEIIEAEIPIVSNSIHQFNANELPNVPMTEAEFQSDLVSTMFNIAPKLKGFAALKAKRGK